MRNAVGCDQLGLGLKPEITEVLRQRGIEFREFGAGEKENPDYPEVAERVAAAIRNGNSIAVS
jgi:ribose 5-phosphate isomerase B